MKRLLIIFIVIPVLCSVWGVAHAVTFDAIDFKGCISEAGNTPIRVSVTDPDSGTLSFDWQILNGVGAAIEGSGADVVFDPPNSGPHPWPYLVKVRVTSSPSGRFAERIIEIFVKIAGDVTGDDVVNASDLLQVRNHFTESGAPGWIDADLNCDGNVNAIDLSKVRNTFSQKNTCDDPDIYFFDNFEGGAGKWTLSGMDWGLITSSFRGGNYSLTDSPGGDYPDNANSTVTIRYSIDLSTATSPVLTFWQKYWVEYQDYIYVEVTTDGGLTWENVNSLGNQVFQSTWTQVLVDLSAYAGQTIKIRFRLREGNSYVTDGWYIDNVEVKEWTNGPALGYPFLDDFENGLTNWMVSGTDWALIDSPTLGGLYAITDSPSGSYPDNANTTLTTAGSIDLSTATSPVLTFWQKYWVEYQDYIYVEVTTDGGLTWENVNSLGNQVFQSTWTQVLVDLSAYAGQTIKIRFRLQESNSYVADGWYIDNVEVKERDE